MHVCTCTDFPLLSLTFHWNRAPRRVETLAPLQRLCPGTWCVLWSLKEREGYRRAECERERSTGDLWEETQGRETCGRTSAQRAQSFWPPCASHSRLLCSLVFDELCPPAASSSFAQKMGCSVVFAAADKVAPRLLSVYSESRSV